MPVRFKTKEEYVNKLVSLIEMEAKCEQIDTEMFALPDLPFEFDERYEIFSKLRLQISRDYMEYIRQGTLLSLVIPHLEGPDYYIGTGVVKKIIIARGKPMTVIVQIDLIDPIDRSKRQATPNRHTEYGGDLCFRVRFDSTQAKNTVKEVQDRLKHDRVNKSIN